MKIASVALAFVVAGGFFAGQVRAQDAEVGEALYGGYCAACHGASGKGDGDMANVINIPAANLTLLAKKNDGVFPMLKVIHVIDGRTGVRGHATVMPLFGAAFNREAEAEAGPYAAILETRGRILSIALYLESIQAQ